MFGIKLRSWMEAHIVRPRKKRSKEAKGKNSKTLPDPPIKSALADPSPISSHTTASPAPAPAKRVTLVSPTPSCKVSHADRSSSPRRPPQLPAAGRGSPRGGSVGGRYSTYLSSPESAYSTGYSTDATSPHGYSPGTSLPPEYYINLRTGTRYFQSADRQRAQASTSSGHLEEVCASGEERVRFGHQRTTSTALAGAQQPHHHPYCRHTVAKVTTTTLEEGGYSYGAPVPQLHRRTESADCSSRPHVTIRTSFAQVEEVSVCASPRRPILVQQQSQLGCNSPRQRSRIRTNPWMSSGSTTTTDKWTTTSSSCSDIAPQQDISTAATIGSWRRDDGHTTTTTADEEENEKVTAFRRPSRRKRGHGEGKGDQVMSPRRGSLTSVSTSSAESSPPSTPRRSSPSSGGGRADEEEDEEDLTLNEIGRFDESYVYEKETDILSDSDPTDCEEDYNNGNLTDRHSSNDYLDMSYQNGISNSSNYLSKADFEYDDDDFDYIDNGPLDLEVPPTSRINTGHCTYHHNNNNFNNNNNVNKNNIVRPPSVHKRSSRRSGKRNKHPQEHHQSPVRKSSQRIKSNESNRRSVSCGARRNKTRAESRVLAEAEVISSGQVTPTYNSNCSTPVVKRRDGGENKKYLFASEVKLIEADKEADRKYRQLILEAESLLVHMKSTSLEEEDEMDLETPIVEQKPFPQLKSPPGSIKSEQPKTPINTPLMNRKSPINTPQMQRKSSASMTPQLLRKSPTSTPQMQRKSPVKTPQMQRKSPIKQMRPDTKALHLQVGELNLPANCHATEERSSPPKPVSRKPQQSVVAIQITTPSGGPPRELVTFRSIDLSSPVAAEAPYCPQSEPLKRKVYTPAALQRLQEHLALADCAESSDSSPPDDEEQSAQDRLGQKVAALRRERLAAEARLASREEERKKRRDRVRAQQQLAVERRNTLLQTLESLKKDLQSQSASLHDAYSSITDLRSPSACDPQRSLVPLTPGTPSQEKPRCDFLSPIRRASSLRCPPPPPPRRC